MGFGDFIDSVGNALDDVAQGAEHLVGTAVDTGAHTVGGALNTLGLHDAATSVDNAGDWAADHLGDQVPEKQLGETTDPTQLVHGDVDKIGQSVSDLRTFTTAFGDTADGLAGVETSHWQGDAAEAFRASYRQHPKQWSDARDACQAAADALRDYSSTVAWAQDQARQAIDLFSKGITATGVAAAQHAQAVTDYNTSATAYSTAAAAGQASGPPPRRPGPFVDPGAADCAQAKAMLTTARQRRDSGGAQAQQAIARATATAPATPSFSGRMLDDAEDTLTAGAVEGMHVVGGVAKGVGDLTKFVRGINPLDPYNVTHPADYLDHMSQTAAGLVHTALRPQELVTGMVGTGWGSDPAEALGKLVPNVVATVGSDGLGAAAEGADVTAVAAETAGQTAAKATAEDASSAGGAAARELAHPPLDSLGPGPDPGWGDFGPTGDQALHAGDVTAAENLDGAGGGLGNFDRDIGGVHAHADTTTTASSSDVVTPSAAHAPPHLTDTGGDGSGSGISSRLNGSYQPPAPIEGADAAASQDIADASGGLRQLEHDEHDVHVRQPEGPEYNNPDYSDPEYEVGPKTSQDYLDKNPITPEDREFLRNAREDWSDAEVLSDPELLGVSRLSTTDVSVLNPAMRTGDQTVLDEWDAQIRATVSGLNKLKPHVGKTARGIHVPSDEMGPFLDRYTKGNIVEEPSFTHSSMSRPYLRNRNVVFLIDSTGGRDISALQPGLQEVVFPPGEQFTVKDAYYNEADHRWYIKLQDSGRGEPDGRP